MENIGKTLRTRLVDDVKEGLKSKSTTFLLSYSSVSAAQVNDLRKDLKRIGARMYVSKNRLAQIALEESDQAQLAKTVEGQIAFIWSDTDAAVVSKLLLDYSKKCKGLQVRGGVLAGVFLARHDVNRLAGLPGREVLLSQVLQVLLSPLTRFAGALNAKSYDLLSILEQLREKKGGS